MGIYSVSECEAHEASGSGVVNYAKTGTYQPPFLKGRHSTHRDNRRKATADENSSIDRCAVAEFDAFALYKAVIDARAAKAQKDKNVQALVESAFALYPLESASKVAKPRYAGLVKEAAELVVQKKDKDEAKKFLEMAGPLAGQLSKETAEKLSALATGKSSADLLQKEVETVRGPIQKAGKDFFDPEVKTRDRGLMTSLARGIIFAAHPTADGPKLLDYKIIPHPSNRDKCTVTITAEYFGAFTGWRYEVDIDIDLEIVNGRSMMNFLGYRDNNAVRSKERNLRDYKDRFNGVR